MIFEMYQQLALVADETLLSLEVPFLSWLPRAYKQSLFFKKWQERLSDNDGALSRAPKILNFISSLEYILKANFDPMELQAGINRWAVLEWP